MSSLQSFLANFALSSDSSDFDRAFAITLGCHSSSSESRCRVFLPRNGPLGHLDENGFRASEDWPAYFICATHRTIYKSAPEDVETLFGFEKSRDIVPFLKILCECAHPGCEKKHLFYTSTGMGWSKLSKSLMSKNPLMACGDHLIEWSPDRIRLVHWNPPSI